jgi:molybdate transport system substrate-binding protein
MMKSYWIKGLVAGLLFSVSQVQAAEKVTVFAAASLTNAMQDIANNYQQLQQKQGTEVQVVASYASSSTLARQIEQGAPADLFISADQQWMDYAIAKQQIVTNTRYTLLGNELVLIAPIGSKADNIAINQNTDWAQLLSGERLSVGDPDHVPVGIYAKEALQKLGAWNSLESKLARANDVRSAMALVERQETPLGIVYASDVFASKKVKVVGIFPASSHQAVEYPMAIVKGHENATVSAFYQYLKSPQAAVVFKQYGFTPR